MNWRFSNFTITVQPRISDSVCETPDGVRTTCPSIVRAAASTSAKVTVVALTPLILTEPGPSADTPYEAQAALLPKNLGEALTALTADDTLRDSFGKAFVDYYVHLKNAELARFRNESGKEQPEPTAWEQREYFDLF